MVEEIDFEFNQRITKFQGLTTLTWTLDWVISDTVVHHSSTSNFICRRTTRYVQTDKQRARLD